MIRIGMSSDTHRLVTGKRLILGGLEIDSPYEAVGHSDADCLLHAIAEAMLGALALGDLGTHFPDTDPAYKGADSKALLSHVDKMVKDNGFVIGNIDTMVHLEKPKLSPHIQNMRASISTLLGIELAQISIKATTGERIGIVGRSEAIICDAVVSLNKKE